MEQILPAQVSFTIQIEGGPSFGEKKPQSLPGRWLCLTVPNPSRQRPRETTKIRKIGAGARDTFVVSFERSLPYFPT